MASSCHFGADSFSAELHCNSNSTNGLQDYWLIFYSDNRQKIFCYFHRFLLFFIFRCLGHGLRAVQVVTSNFTSPFFKQIYSYIRPFPLLSTISVLSFSPLRKWWCLYTKSVTPYSILLSAIQHLHRLSTHTHFSLSLFQLSSTNDNFCAKEKLWSFILTLTVIFIIFLLFFLFGGEQ